MSDIAVIFLQTAAILVYGLIIAACISQTSISTYYTNGEKAGTQHSNSIIGEALFLLLFVVAAGLNLLWWKPMPTEYLAVAMITGLVVYLRHRVVLHEVFWGKVMAGIFYGLTTLILVAAFTPITLAAGTIVFIIAGLVYAVAG